MTEKRVKDLMVPIDEYPVVSPETTMLDAISALNEAQKKRPPNLQPYRAVLVKDKGGDVIGKLGQLAFLKALEPKHTVLGDLEKLRFAGVSDDLMQTMIGHYRFFEEALPELCARGRNLMVKDAMNPATESIDENAYLCEAISKIVLYQQLSILVTRGKRAVGVLRLSDLCDEVARQMKKQAAEEA